MKLPDVGGAGDELGRDAALGARVVLGNLGWAIWLAHHTPIRGWDRNRVSGFMVFEGHTTMADATAGQGVGAVQGGVELNSELTVHGSLRMKQLTRAAKTGNRRASTVALVPH